MLSLSDICLLQRHTSVNTPASQTAAGSRWLLSSVPPAASCSCCWPGRWASQQSPGVVFLGGGETRTTQRNRQQQQYVSSCPGDLLYYLSLLLSLLVGTLSNSSTKTPGTQLRHAAAVAATCCWGASGPHTPGVSDSDEQSLRVLNCFTRDMHQSIKPTNPG